MPLIYSVYSDGHCDSPGRNARYGTYTLIDDDTGKVVAFRVVMVFEVIFSNAMEKKSFKTVHQKPRG